MDGDFRVCLAQARFDECVQDAPENTLPGGVRLRIRLGAG
jgi:hypothetical protein